MASYPVTLYDDDVYNGRPAKLSYGSYRNMSLTGVGNDTVSSLIVAPFTTLTLYEHSDWRGRSVTIVGPKEIPYLSEYLGGFNDYTSSVKVTRAEPPIGTKLACCSGQPGVCGEFVAGSAMCATAMVDYCTGANSNTNMATNQCKAWARNNTATADTAVSKYCAANPADPFCTCILSPAQVKGVINPKCVDRKCLDTGYLTTNMVISNCPSSVTCTVQNTLANTGVIFANSTPIQQNCGNTTILPSVGGGSPVVIPDPTAVINPPTSQYVPPPADTSSSIFSPMLILIFVLFIALAILGAVVYKRRRDRMSAAPATLVR